MGIYHVATMRSMALAKKPYRAGDFDLLAAYIIPCDLWYIIPAREVVGIRMISLCPGHAPSKNRSRLPHERLAFRPRRLEKYREAWWLLRGSRNFKRA